MEKTPKRFFGIDVSPELVKLCRRRISPAAVGSATELSSVDGAIEAIHCDNVIEHLNPRHTVRMPNGFARVLKVGDLVDLQQCLGMSAWNTLSHVRPRTPSAIKKLFRYEGEDFLNPENDHLRSLP